MTSLRIFGRSIAAIFLTATIVSAGEFSTEDARRLGVFPDEAISFQSLYRASESAPEEGVRQIRAANLDGGRFLFHVAFGKRPNFLIADFKFQFKIPAIPGKSPVFDDILRISLANYGLLPSTGSSAALGDVRAVQSGTDVWFTYQLPTPSEAPTVPARFTFSYLTAPKSAEQKPSGAIVIQLPKQSLSLPAWPERKTTLILPDSEYRLITDQLSTSDTRTFKDILGTAYEALSNKGLNKEDIAKITTDFQPPRAIPPLIANLPTPPESKAPPGLKVPFHVLEESGINHAQAPISVGIPFPKGAAHSTTGFVITREDGREVPASFSLRAKWPDGSVKWVFAAFQDNLEAHQNSSYLLKASTEPSISSHGLVVSDSGRELSVNTGTMTVVLDKERFLPFAEVRLAGSPETVPLTKAGIEFETENGRIFSSGNCKPESLRIEEQSDQHCVIRVEGRYADAQGNGHMRYVARLSFRANSALAGVTLTHINDALDHEFSEILSLHWPVLRPGSVGGGQVALSAFEEKPLAGKLDVFQWNDRLSEINLEKTKDRIPGGFVIHTTGGGKIGLAIEDFWQRYPKGIRADETGLTIDFLPTQPGKDFGGDLPVHLSFPYLEGLYRTKWGMAFTQHVAIDFAGARGAREMAALAQRPLVGVLPASIYANSGVFGSFPVDNDGLPAQWDKFFDGAFRAHEARRERQREYGFLNYGDWYGERGRNWGNNEYDTAHAFFQQFARSGHRDYFRSALAAARHQADVDIIHAYPDPFYIGGNYIHGIAHTGTTSHRPRQGIWSQDYGLGAWGSNGHTWAEGMCEAWLMSGDQRSAEASLELAEHLRWAVAPNFKMDVPNPRYAGWAVRATTDLYRTFADPEYLETARIITARSSDYQDPVSGGWLYPLYGGPAGNSVYMHGIVLAGLSEYYDETGDPKALEVMKGAGHFIKQAWVKNGYWPYMVVADGAPHPKRDPAAATSLNFMLAEGLAYLGLKQHDSEALRIAIAASEAQLKEGPPEASGQKIGNTLRSGVRLFGYLEEAAPEPESTKKDAPGQP